MNSTFLPLAATLLLTLTSCDPYFGTQSGYGGYGYGGGSYGSNGYRNSYGSSYNRSYAPAYGGRSNYTYYPSHNTYYHPQTQQYHYNTGSSWVSSSRPPSSLQASHSVPLNLSSHPQNHHSEVSKSYPRTWNSSGSSNNSSHHEHHDGDHSDRGHNWNRDGR